MKGKGMVMKKILALALVLLFSDTVIAAQVSQSDARCWKNQFYGRTDGLCVETSSYDLEFYENGTQVFSIDDGGEKTVFSNGEYFSNATNGTIWTDGSFGIVSQSVGVSFNDMRVHDNLAALLPVAAAADDAGNVPGTVGTTAPSVQGVDFGGASTDEKAAFSIVVPPTYFAGSTLTLTANAGMLTTVSDGTATLDFECWVPDYANADGTVSSDLVTTAATSINSTTFADVSFTVDDDVSGHVIASGDLIQCRMSFAGSDTGNAGAGITGVVRKLNLVVSS